MDKFNLIVSTGRDFENQAKTELWFNLISLGDDTPIIFSSEISGLILGYTKIPPRKLIYYLQDIMANKDMNYTQYIHKIYPLDVVVESDIIDIEKAVLDLVKTHPYCTAGSKFRITIRKRRTELETQDIIKTIAGRLDFPVSLKDYDWNLQIEIVGKYTGISVLKDSDIFRPVQKRKKSIEAK